MVLMTDSIRRSRCRSVRLLFFESAKSPISEAYIGRNHAIHALSRRQWRRHQGRDPYRRIRRSRTAEESAKPRRGKSSSFFAYLNQLTNDSAIGVAQTGR